MKTKVQSLKAAIIGLASIAIGSSCFALSTSYGTANHTNPYWQELATPSQNDDKGVFWSVDDGATWGRETLLVGQTVRFQFNMHKEHVGTHYADFLKAWLDWDQNGIFDADEVIMFAKQLLPTDPEDLGTHKTPDVADFVFVSDGFLIDQSHYGNLALRARVTCSESLNAADGAGWDYQWDRSDESYNSLFTPTVSLYQGEVEEWNISAVPDASSTIALLGTALFGLTFFRGRFRR